MVFTPNVLAVASLVLMAENIAANPVNNSPFLLTFVNKHHVPIIVDNGSSGKLVNGQSDSTIPPNGTTSYRMTLPFSSGAWQINTAQGGITGQDSLVEATSNNHNGLFMDVSFVTGFTLPVTCGCESKGMIIGCNKDLRELNGGCEPGSLNRGGACMNLDGDTPIVRDFYKPCEGGAYAHSGDAQALVSGFCNGHDLVCCIGTDCPDAYKQPNATNTGFHLAGSNENSTSKKLGKISSEKDIWSPSFRPAGVQILPYGSKDGSTHLSNKTVSPGLKSSGGSGCDRAEK